MHVKVELSLQVVRAEFTEMGFIPYDDVGFTDLVETGPAGEEGVYCGWDMFEVLLDEFSLGA
jgi:hypothetical protein